MRLVDANSFPFKFFLGISNSLPAFVSMIYIPTLPVLAFEFNASVLVINWTLALTLIGGSIGQIFWGPFSDFYGRKKGLCLGFAVTCLACLVCLPIKKISLVLLGRFLIGFGAAAGVTIVRAICRDLYEGSVLEKMVAWILMIIPFVSASAPLLGNFLVEYHGWRGSFVFVLLLNAVLLILTPIFLRKKKQIVANLDLRKILQNYCNFFACPRTLLFSVSSSLIYAMFFIYFSSSSWVYNNYFGISGVQTSLFLMLFSFGGFLGGLFQSSIGWRLPTNRLLIVCWSALILILWGTVLYVEFARETPFLYSLSLTVSAGLLSVFNTICTTRTIRQHPRQLAGTLSSFLCALQTLGCAVGSLLSYVTRQPIAVLLSILFLVILSVTLYTFALRGKGQNKGGSSALFEF